MGFLRMLLAFAVLAGHTGVLDFEILPGPVAVRAFFLLSGFTMALVLEGRYAGLPVRAFYLSRLLRLAPAYAAVLLLSLAAVLLLDAHPFLRRATLADLAGNGGTLAPGCGPTWRCSARRSCTGCAWPPGSALVWSPGPVAATARGYTLLLVPRPGPCPWSSASTWPRPGSFPGGTPGGLAAGGQSGPARGPDRFFPRLDPVWQRFLPTQLYLFLAGYFAHSIYARLRDTRRERLLGRSLLLLLALFAVLYEILAGPMRFAVFQCLLCLALPWCFLAFRNSPLDRFLGRLSYPFYLVHYLVIGLFEEYWGEAGPSGPGGAGAGRGPGPAPGGGGSLRARAAAAGGSGRGPGPACARGRGGPGGPAPGLRGGQESRRARAARTCSSSPMSTGLAR